MFKVRVRAADAQWERELDSILRQLQCTAYYRTNITVACAYTVAIQRII